MAFALTLPMCTAIAAVPSDSTEELDQVYVYGLRAETWELRRALVQAENLFYERYNELNAKDDFDMKCRVEARTGTRLGTRICRPVYQEDAIQEGAKNALEIRQYFQSYGGKVLASPPVPAAMVIEARRLEFQKHMRQLVLESSELTSLLRKRAAAAEKLEAAMRRDRAKGAVTRPSEDHSGR